MKISVNGVTIEGTTAQVTEVLKKLGSDGLIYNSSSKGPMLIKDMAKAHLKHAIIKLYEAWVSNLKSTDDITFCRRMVEGPSDNSTLVAMLNEFESRP